MRFIFKLHINVLKSSLIISHKFNKFIYILTTNIHWLFLLILVFYSLFSLPSIPFSRFLLDWLWCSLEKAMAPHSSTLAWKIPWMEEPGELQSMGSLRVRHDWATSLSLHFHALEKETATHSSTLAWRIPGTEEPGGLQSMGLWRVRHDWVTSLPLHFHALEKEMATHSSVLAWRIPGTGEPGGLPSMGSQSRTQLKWLSS